MGVRRRVKTTLKKLYPKKTITEDIVVIDSALPNKDAVGPSRVKDNYMFWYCLFWLEFRLGGFYAAPNTQI